MDYDNIDLNLIKYFVSVYENGGIINASKKLFISQPAVTISIKKLESILGGKLFIRLPKGSKPTLEGEKFYQYCKSALNKIELGIKEFAQFESLSKGDITIGASHDVINFIILPKINEFLKSYPNINFNFVEIIPKKLSQYMFRGDIDIAFLEDKTLLNDYKYHTIEKLDNAFFVNKKYKNEINKENVIDNKLIIYKKDSGNYDSLEKLIKSNNVLIEPKFTVSNFATMENLCNLNSCIGFAPKKYINLEKYEIFDTKFNIEPTVINMCYSNDENLSFVCKKFIEFFM